MHFCGRHTGRQVIYCIFFCQVCQYIKVQHSKIDFTFWRRHNNVFHESRSETKSGRMEQQMQLCSSRVDSGSVPSYLVIQGLQDRSDFNTTIVARRKRQFSGAGDNWRQLKGRRFVFFPPQGGTRVMCAAWLIAEKVGAGPGFWIELETNMNASANTDQPEAWAIQEIFVKARQI